MHVASTHYGSRPSLHACQRFRSQETKDFQLDGLCFVADGDDKEDAM